MLFFRFFADMWDPLRPRHPKKCKNTTLAGKKEDESTGAYETRAQSFRVYLSKMSWTLDTERIWGDKLEPACVDGPLCESRTLCGTEDLGADIERNDFGHV